MFDTKLHCKGTWAKIMRGQAYSFFLIQPGGKCCQRYLMTYCLSYGIGLVHLAVQAYAYKAVDSIQS